MQKKPSQFVIRVALYCLPALAALRPKLVTDPDIWWHTRIGEWIVQHRTVPVTDPFSTFGAGKTWFAYSWSFDLLFYWLQHKFGLVGYVGYVAVMTLAIAVVLTHFIERFEPRFAWSSALVAVGLFALGRMYTPRSWLVTILFFLLLLEILVSYREGRRKALLLLPPLFFIWANIHIQFVYGLAVLGIACIESFAPERFGGEGRRRWDLPVVTLFCVLATCVNPYGIWIYRTVAVYARQHPDMIQEMQAIQFRVFADWIFLVTLLLAVFVLGWRRRVKLFPVLLLAFGIFVGFKSVRDVWVALFVALYILADSQPVRPSKPVRIPVPAVLTSIVVIAALAGIRHLSQEQLQEAVAQHYPLEAINVVAANHYPGPLFNDYDWGGYLMWKLPELPVSIDGRMDLQGDEHFKDSWATWMAGPNWNTDPELKHANVVIANRSLPLTSVLREDPQFQIVHEDKLSIVFVRRAKP